MYFNLIQNLILPNISDEVKRSFGTPFEEMILECLFNSNQCTYADFDWYYGGYYSNCFKFNSGKSWNGSKSEIKTLLKTGKINGLELKLYIESSSELFSFSSGKGLHVFIHNQSVLPTIFDGFDVALDFKTNVAVSRVFSKRLSSPYSGCVDNIEAFDSIFTRVFQDNHISYSQSQCFNYCYQRRLTEKCNCYDASFPFFTFGKGNVLVSKTIHVI